MVLKGTRDEIWTSPLPKVISRYTKPDGSELCREDFANKDVYFDIVTIPAKDAYYAMHIPNDITITVETAQGDVLHANLLISRMPRTAREIILFALCGKTADRICQTSGF